ncbi:MAG: AAA family ATPase [Patescibacteria group bacterium]|nr:AAA family ATPase [Patescibacteria group bacterium]
MPQNRWDEVIGHQQIIKLLDLWVECPAFSYLFYGPSHLGKTFVADKFVRALVGVDAHQDLNLHPDVVMFLPEEGKKDVSVESVRDNRMRLYQRPQISKRVVAFLPKLDRLNETGFNALLKVMEEPPAGAVFVAVAENISRIPSTILSRTVSVPFGLVPKETIRQALEDRGFSKQNAQQKSSICRGRPGIALQDEDEGGTFFDVAERFVTGPTIGHRMSAVEEMKKQCESTEDVAAAWSSAMESCMLAIRSDFNRDAKQALILAQGVADAQSAIGGPLSPRLMLDASAIQASRNYLPMPNLYPKYFPLSLT